MDPLRKRFFVNGEPVAGSVLHAAYLKPVAKLLDAVKARMQLGGLSQLAQRYVTEDGAVLTAMSRFGQDEIRIDVPFRTPITPIEQTTPREKHPQFVEYCAIGPDHEWLSPEISHLFMGHAVILMDRGENYAYVAQPVPETQSQPENNRAKLIVLDVHLNIAGEIDIPPLVENNITSRVMHYDAMNDVFALSLIDWRHAEYWFDTFPVGLHWASGDYTYPIVSWSPGANGYTAHHFPPPPSGGGSLLNEFGAYSHEGGSFYLGQGQADEPDLVLASDGFAVINAVPDAVRWATVSSSRGDWLAYAPDMGSFDIETETYAGITDVVVDLSGIGWAGGVELRSPWYSTQFAFNNAATHLFHLSSSSSVTIKGQASSESIAVGQYGTPRELLHDPVTDAIAVCFSNVGALILNARDCMDMPIPPFFHAFRTIPAGQDADGKAVPVTFTQFMHGSLLGRIQTGLEVIFCKIDIGRLHQTKITAQIE